jgi:hypothetical protein
MMWNVVSMTFSFQLPTSIAHLFGSWIKSLVFRLIPDIKCCRNVLGVVAM